VPPDVEDRPVPDPFVERDQLDAALETSARIARGYLERIGEERVLSPDVEVAIGGWTDPMPEEGVGALNALAERGQRAREAATRSSGPRFFNFVMGGGTPAALGADWLTSAYDQIAFAWASSPFAARLEQIAVDRLRQLFELPPEFGGVLTTGATMANLVALAAARNWWGERHGVDVEKEGVGRLAPVVILSSGDLHPSAIQAVGMLGFGRGNIRRLARNEVGRLDLVALERELRQAATPAIVIANAGEVNAGDFDPIADVADLCERYSAWLHVDGAFGLFARLTPSTRALTEGVERADSVISDGHKWLNVPYDCGFAFVREMERVPRALNVGAPYLPSADDPHPNFGFASPENSRRACALAVWATLRAYARTGYREMVERHVRLARHFAECVDASPQLERLADVPLNIVCFRAHLPGFSEERLNELNTRVGDALRAGRARVRGHNHLRREGGAMTGDRQLADGYSDVELIVDVTRELTQAERILAS
jgi:glutamate/tyrosine decarboxylase-like PLP-dependent enzyme